MKNDPNKGSSSGRGKDQASTKTMEALRTAVRLMADELETDPAIVMGFMLNSDYRIIGCHQPAPAPLVKSRALKDRLFSDLLPVSSQKEWGTAREHMERHDDYACTMDLMLRATDKYALPVFSYISKVADDRTRLLAVPTLLGDEEAERKLWKKIDIFKGRLVAPLVTDGPFKIPDADREKMFHVSEYLLRCIDMALAPPLSIPDLAHEFFINEFKLKRYFKWVHGVPIFKFYTDNRLKKAAKLLTRTDVPVSEVAERARFKNASHFTKAFKQKYKSTPAQYRKDHTTDFEELKKTMRNLPRNRNNGLLGYPGKDDE